MMSAPTSPKDETVDRERRRLRGADYCRSPVASAVRTMNEEFGGDLDRIDKLFLDQWAADLATDPYLTEHARQEDLDSFRRTFDRDSVNALNRRMERNASLVRRILSDNKVCQMLLGAVAAEFHANARRQAE